MKKRLTALLLVLSLVLSLGATVAFATDEDDVLDAPVVDDPVVEDAPVVDDPVVEDDPVEDDPDGDESQQEVSFADLTVEEQYAKLLSNPELGTGLVETLTEDQLAMLVDYANSLPIATEDDLVTVPYLYAGPFGDTVTVPYVSFRRSVMRYANTGTNASTEYGSDDGLGLKKTASYDDTTGLTTITLEAFTTGKVTTSISSTPCDIIFVIDQSGSMAWGMKGENTVTTDVNGDNPVRLELTQKIMRDFLSEVAERTVDGEGNVLVHHRIAVIGFSSSGYGNDELLTGVTISNKNGAQYGSISNAQYANALQDVSTVEGYTSVSNAIDALSAYGGTQPTSGFEMASEVFRNSTAVAGEEERQRVVIFLTDGEPDNIESTGFGHEVAENAVAAAAPLKSEYHATVYTIGIFEGANPEYIGETGTAMMDVTKTDRANRFMNLASSNYPTANSFYLRIETVFGIQLRWLANVPDRNTEGEYYLAATSSEELSKIFKTIESNISSSTIKLGEKTEIRDVISDYFELPENTDENSIKLYTVECTGKSGNEFTFTDVRNPLNSASVTISADKKTVSVSNFNFDEHYVTEEAKPDTDNDHGRKLVIEFSVKQKDGFLGGNNVPTNGAASSVYDKDGNPVENFTVPTTSVPIGDIVVMANDQNVYLLGSVTKEQLLSGSATVGGTQLNLNPAAENYGLQSWQTAYVDITVEIKDESGTVVNSFTDLTDDQTYSVTVTVSPKETVAGGATAKTGTANAAINVFKPELTYEDKTIYVGNVAVYNPVEVWKHVDPDTDTVSTDDDVTMTGQKPTLTLSYDPESTALTECTDVNVTAKIGSTDVTAHVTFYNGGNKHIGSASEAEFTVHVLKPIITVETQDIWADTETTFNLSDYCFQKTDNKPFVCTWQDTTSGHATPSPLPSGAPSVDVSFTFKNGDATINNSYTVGQEDETITVSVLTYTLGNGYTSDVNLTDKGFTVHVNKFTMTITKDWGTTAGTYKQSCIFDVKLGSEVVATVVIPNGESSVTIGGLLCGKEYTVEEQGDWSWRFTKGQKTTLTSHSHPIANEQPTGHAPVNVAVRNELSISQWLSGDFWAINRSGTGLVTDKKGGSQ